MTPDPTPAFLANLAARLTAHPGPITPADLQAALAAACAEVMGEKGGTVWLRYEGGECRVKVWKWEVR